MSSIETRRLIENLSGKFAALAMQIPMGLAKEQLQSIGQDIYIILSGMSARIETLEKQLESQ
jgi:hypothetical protein